MQPADCLLVAEAPPGLQEHNSDEEQEDQAPPDPSSEPDRAQRTVFVGNLPASTSRRAVKNIFSRQAALALRALQPSAVMVSMFSRCPCASAHQLSLAEAWCCRYGAVDKVYLRSLAVDPGAKMPRRAAIITGQVQSGAAGNAYILFKDTAAAEAALAHNMQLVRAATSSSRSSKLSNIPSLVLPHAKLSLPGLTAQQWTTVRQQQIVAACSPVVY